MRTALALTHFCAFLWALSCFALFTAGQQLQNTMYVDSEYRGTISNGEKETPYTTFERAFEKACSQNSPLDSDKTSLIIFALRMTPYSITSQLSYSNCGAIKLQISQELEESQARLIFTAPLNLDNVFLTFERFEFSVSNLAAVPSSGLLQASNSTLVFSNCTFRAASSNIRDFLSVVQTNLIVNSSKFYRSLNSLGNVMRRSQATFDGLDIYFEDDPYNSLFRCLDEAPEIPTQSSIKASNIRIMPNPDSKNSSKLPGNIFAIDNTNFELEKITISSVNGAFFNSTNAGHHTVVASMNKPNLTLHIRDFTLNSSTPLFPFIRILAKENAENLLMTIDSIKIVRSETSYYKELLSTHYGLFQVKIERENTKIYISNVSILDSQEFPKFSVPLYGFTHLFFLNLLPTTSVKISNVTIHNNAFFTNVFYVKNSLNALIIENVTISSSILYSKFFLLETKLPFQHDPWRLGEQNWVLNGLKIDDVQSHHDFISLRLGPGGPSPSPYQRDAIYLNATDIKFDNFSLVESSDDIFSVFRLTDIGLRVYSSSFQSISLSEGMFVSIEESMVPVLFKNSRFDNFLGEYASARFFSKARNYLQESLYPEANGTVRSHPLFASFFLINNMFSGIWAFRESPQTIDLNVPNAFIINNTFRNFTTQNSGDFIAVRELSAGGYAEKLDPHVLDKYLIDLETRDLFKQYLNASENISSIFVFYGNSFEKVTLVNSNLVYVSGLIPKALFLFQNNQFINGTAAVGNKTEGRLVFDSLLTVINSPNVVIKDNVVYNFSGFLRFFEASMTSPNDSTIRFEGNTFEQNNGVLPLSVTGSSFALLTFSNNSIVNCTGNSLDLITFTVGGNLQRDFEFSHNLLSNISIRLTELDEAKLIKLDFPFNLQGQILISNLTIMGCDIFYDDNSRKFGLRSTLVYIMNPNSITKLYNNWIEANSGQGIASFMIIYSKEVEIDSLDFHSNPPRAILEWESTILISTISFKLTNSRATHNVGTNGGVFYFENLLTNSTLMMNLTINNNTFEENGANYGGVFYFSEKNSFSLNLQADSNKFIHNVGFIRGGVFFLETQTIYAVEIINSEYRCYDYLIYAGSFLSASGLTKPDYSHRNPNFIIRETQVTIDYHLLPKASKMSSIIHIWANEFMTSEVNFVVDGLMLHGISHIDRFDSSIHWLYAEGSTISIKNLNLSHMKMSRHAISVTSKTVLSIHNSIFHNNTFQLGYKDLCLIKVYMHDSHSDYAEIEISNATFSNNVFIEVPEQSSLICIDAPKFNLSLLNNTIVRQNRNKAPVLFSKVDNLERKNFARKIVLSDSIFEDNSGMTLEGGLIHAEYVELDILNCVFTNNSGAHHGGAISVINPLLIFIQSSQFTLNTVGKDFKVLYSQIPKGGALHVKLADPYNYEPSITIIDSCFKENTVFDGQGGAIYFSSIFDPKSIRLIPEQNTFEGNKALVGDDISTCPTAAELYIQDRRDSSRALVSGLRDDEFFPEMIHNLYFYHQKLNFTFLDFFNNSMAPLGSSPFVVRDYSLALKFNDLDGTITSRECTHGWCIISGDQIKVRGAAYDLKRMDISIITSGGHIIGFRAHAKVRPCQIGEINATTERICVACESGSFSVNPNETACHACPTGMKCWGGSNITVRADYWRANLISGNVYPCAPGYCKEGSHGNEICTEGRIGPFCLGCDIQNDYTPGTDGSCTKCSTSWLALLPTILYHIIVILIEIWVIWRMRLINNAIIIENKFNERYLEKVSRGGYLLRLLLYFQILSIIQALPFLSFGTETIQSTLPLNPSQALFYSLNCPLKNLGVSPGDIYYWKLRLISTLPFVKITGFAIYGTLVKYFNRSYHLKSFIIVAIIGIAVVEQPGVIAKMISMFSCQSTDPKDPNAAHFVTIAPVVECWTPQFNAFRNFIAIPTLFLWSIFLPCACFIVLFRNKHRLRTLEFARYFGSIYSGYKSKHYLWLLVQMVMIIAITIVSQLGTMDQTSRGMSIILFFAAYLIYLQAAQPYRFEALYRTDLIATGIYIATTYLAVYGAMSAKWLHTTVRILTWAINICFVIFLVIKLLKVYAVAKLINKCFGGMLWSESEIESTKENFQRTDSVSNGSDDPINLKFEKESAFVLDQKRFSAKNIILVEEIPEVPEDCDEEELKERRFLGEIQQRESKL